MELEVLKILWEEAPCTVREVMNHLHARGRKVAYTTVLTFLSRLEQKGYVKSDRSGVAYVYKPTVTRARVTRSRLRALLEQLYDGTPGNLVLQLVEQGELSDDEITALQRRIEELDAARPPAKGPARKPKKKGGRTP